MKNSIGPNSKVFFDALYVIEKNLKYVEQLGIEEDTIKGYKKILEYLKSRNAGEIEKIIGIKSSRIQSVSKSAGETLGLTDEELKELTPSMVLDLIADRTVPRTALERIGTLRFGLTRGGISSLRTRGALVDKLIRMLEHEATHYSIARAASGVAAHLAPASDNAVQPPTTKDGSNDSDSGDSSARSS